MPAAEGTYTLLLRLDSAVEREVGALGSLEFPTGWYAYTGSALGPGGFARIDRHRRIAAGTADTRHWHIDYFLPVCEPRGVYTAADEAIECAVAQSLPGDRLPAFGASDCQCDSHLVHTADESRLRQALERHYGPAR
ncbi:MAG: DUF123 domain-containing protein [Halobacteriales archaeon]